MAGSSGAGNFPILDRVTAPDIAGINGPASDVLLSFFFGYRPPTTRILAVSAASYIRRLQMGRGGGRILGRPTAPAGSPPPTPDGTSPKRILQDVRRGRPLLPQAFGPPTAPIEPIHTVKPVFRAGHGTTLGDLQRVQGRARIFDPAGRRSLPSEPLHTVKPIARTGLGTTLANLQRMQGRAQFFQPGGRRLPAAEPDHTVKPIRLSGFASQRNDPRHFPGRVLVIQPSGRRLPSSPPPPSGYGGRKTIFRDVRRRQPKIPEPFLSVLTAPVIEPTHTVKPIFKAGLAARRIDLQRVQGKAWVIQPSGRREPPPADPGRRPGAIIRAGRIDSDPRRLSLKLSGGRIAYWYVTPLILPQNKYRPQLRAGRDTSRDWLLRWSPFKPYRKLVVLAPPVAPSQLAPAKARTVSTLSDPRRLPRFSGARFIHPRTVPDPVISVTASNPLILLGL